MDENNDLNQQNDNLPGNKKDEEEEKKKNRKRMWIIIGIAIGLVIILVVVLLLLLTFCKKQDLTGEETAEITLEGDTAEETTAGETPETTADTSPATTETTAGETTGSEETTTDTEETPEEEIAVAPTIRLEIDEGPYYSPADEVCYYRVRASVTGTPDPEIEWNIDDSLGSYLPYKVQVNIDDPSESRTLRATATNSAGSETATMVLSWGCNRPPEIQEITLTDYYYTDAEYSIPAIASDPDGDTLTYQWVAEGGTIFDEDVNPMDWTTPETPGFYDLTVYVDDGNGGTDSLTETVEVKEPNRPPVVGSITVAELKTGFIPPYYYTNQRYEISVEAADPDGDILTYNWTATKGTVYYRTENPAEWKAPSSQGDCTINVTVNDGRGGTASNFKYIYVSTYVY